jgi:peroxiredoxin Q/BCP
MPAPNFELLDQNQNLHKLSDYVGKWLVIYFYPKDDTPGCTKEACAFRDDIVKLQSLNAQVLGVSVDTTASHAEFMEKYSLQFPLLADTEGKVAESYGSLTNLGLLKLAKRHTFIIGPQGNLAKIYRSVKPATHSDEVIAEIQKLQN